MTTTHQVPGREPERSAVSAVSAAGGAPLTLAAEHARLLEQVAMRARDLLKAIAGDRWPARELRALVGYLRAEVLRQAADQERLFPAGPAADGFARLARDHVRLRAGTEVLAQAASVGTGSRAQLAAATRDLLTQFERHLASEERLLTAAARPAITPGITAATGRRHEWYPLTEGPVIDLDVLPSGQVADAAVDRLLRLHPGEQVELRSGRDPWPVWRRMDGLGPGRYGFAYLQDGPDRWRVQVTRRPAA
ncbi:MAG: hemerythrin domain-containing protein [Streptosporangiaceae bacterium]